MALSAGLFRDQEQNESDLTDGPGWTIDEQKPSIFENSLAAIPRGIGQGVDAGLSVLAKGLQFGGPAAPSDASVTGPSEDLRAMERSFGATGKELQPWQKEYNASLEGSAATYRDFGKSLTPDPRITGAGANLIQGFSKAVTEFSAGSALGGPYAGAGLLGAAEGYGRYQDLRDQGVDEKTATNSGLLEAVTSGGSAILPMGMPARWLKGLSTAGTLLTQAGAGAAINTSFGMASRYAGAKILQDAGYPEQAEQQKPLDEENMLADALSGLFFGAHAGWHGLKDINLAHVDPAIRDAAKVVQDRQEIADRAPGVPVDMKSAAVHRASLESSLDSLMNGKAVDLAHLDSEGATFARPEIDESQAADVIREEFEKSGVLESAGEYDRWVSGEPEAKPAPEAEPKPAPDFQAATPEEIAAHTAEVKKPLAQRMKEAGEEETPKVSPGALEDRPDLQIVNEDGEPQKAADAQARAIENEAQANSEAEPMHAAAVACEARHA